MWCACPDCVNTLHLFLIVFLISRNSVSFLLALSFRFQHSLFLIIIYHMSLSLQHWHFCWDPTECFQRKKQLLSAPFLPKIKWNCQLISLYRIVINLNNLSTALGEVSRLEGLEPGKLQLHLSTLKTGKERTMRGRGMKKEREKTRHKRDTGRRVEGVTISWSFLYSNLKTVLQRSTENDHNHSHLKLNISKTSKFVVVHSA